MQNTNTRVAKVPVFQAPLVANPKQAEFVSAVSNTGAVGIYSSCFVHIKQLEADLKQIKNSTKQPFAVLVDMLDSDDSSADMADKLDSHTVLKSAYKKLSIKATEPPALPDANEVCKAVVSNRPPIIIFQNGLPTDEFIEHCEKIGITTFAVASNTLEVIAIDDSNITGIILQGLESAGVLSKFDNDLNAGFFPVHTLLHHAQQNTDKFLVTWGNAHTPETAETSLALGACAVVVDSPLWTVTESPIPSNYKKVLKNHNEMLNTITRNFTGTPAQVISNELSKVLTCNHFKNLSAKQQQSCLLPIFNAAYTQNNADYLPMWAGSCMVDSSGSLSDVVSRYEKTLAKYIQ